MQSCHLPPALLHPSRTLRSAFIGTKNAHVRERACAHTHHHHHTHTQRHTCVCSVSTKASLILASYTSTTTCTIYTCTPPSSNKVILPTQNPRGTLACVCSVPTKVSLILASSTSTFLTREGAVNTWSRVWVMPYLHGERAVTQY